jgi:predicted hotdog family 3-hydroxylacyl-ACP dehydratase
MAEFPIPAGELTPHAPPMLLIDEVLACSRDRVNARATVKADGLFFQPGRGLPGYVGFEILAQAIAAYDGWMRRQEGDKPTIGFLLGCRKYQCAVEWFAAGDVLEIEADSLIHEGEMRSFDCRLKGAGGTVLASGVLNVYRPNDPEAFFRRA